MTTGERIANLRHKFGYSQPALADKMHVGQSTVAMWELNKRNINNQSLVKLADLFNVSTDYLLGKSDIKNPYSEKDDDDDLLDIDENSIMTFEGKPIPPEDLKVIKRILRSAREDDR